MENADASTARALVRDSALTRYAAGVVHRAIASNTTASAANEMRPSTHCPSAPRKRYRRDADSRTIRRVPDRGNAYVPNRAPCRAISHSEGRP